MLILFFTPFSSTVTFKFPIFSIIFLYAPCLISLFLYSSLLTFHKDGWSRKYPINNRVTSRDQGREAGAPVTDILRWWKLHANWLRRMSSDPSTHWSQWVYEIEQKREREQLYAHIWQYWVSDFRHWLIV